MKSYIFIHERYIWVCWDEGDMSKDIRAAPSSNLIGVSDIYNIYIDTYKYIHIYIFISIRVEMVSNPFCWSSRWEFIGHSINSRSIRHSYIQQQTRTRFINVRGPHCPHKYCHRTDRITLDLVKALKKYITTELADDFKDYLRSMTSYSINPDKDQISFIILEIAIRKCEI